MAWSLRGRRRATEPLLRPPQPHDTPADPGEVADGVEQDLGVVAAGLHAQIAAAAGRVERVARERRDVDQGGGAGRARPKRSTPSRSNSVGPKPTVSVSRAGCRPSASPVSVGGSASLVAGSPTGRPWVRRSAAASSRCSSCYELGPTGGHDVERRRTAGGPGRRWRCRPGGRRGRARCRSRCRRRRSAAATHDRARRRGCRRRAPPAAAPRHASSRRREMPPALGPRSEPTRSLQDQRRHPGQRLGQGVDRGRQRPWSGPG